MRNRKKLVFTAQTIVNLPMTVHPDIVELAQGFLDLVGEPSMYVEKVGKPSAEERTEA